MRSGEVDVLQQLLADGDDGVDDIESTNSLEISNNDVAGNEGSELVGVSFICYVILLLSREESFTPPTQFKTSLKYVHKGCDYTQLKCCL